MMMMTEVKETKGGIIRVNLTLKKHKRQKLSLGNRPSMKGFIHNFGGYYMMLLPILLYFIVFKYGPMYGIIISFKEFYPLKGIAGSEWVGLEHFKTMFTGLYFWPVFKNTIIISFYKLIWGFPAPIILALIINEIGNAKFKKVAQTVSYMPHFLSWVIVSGIVIEMLSPSRGPLNVLFTSLGLETIYFVADPKWFRAVLVGSGIWQGIGWGSIIYLAAISGIDPQLYEAASIDGATRFQRIRFITLPSLKPVVVIMLIFACGRIINDNFEQIYNLLNPNVYSVGDVISTYTYEQGLVNLQYSYSTAVGLFKNIISFSLVVLANSIAKRVSEYAIW